MKYFYQGMRKGFTLIELLIVVAIIAILAAIAIPNFLAAQVRSKVSRAKGEMRTIATALESYNVDNNQYVINLDMASPFYTRGNGLRAPLIPLTTPVSYLTSIPADPFVLLSVGWPETFIYYCDGTIIPATFQPGFYDKDWTWALWTFGPNGRSDWGTAYDPTNGTVSNGDIGRFGP